MFTNMKMITIAVQNDDEWNFVQVEEKLVEKVMHNGKTGTFQKHNCFFIFVADCGYMAVAILGSNGHFQNMTNTSLYLFNSIYL